MGGQVSFEDISNRRLLNERQLDAEANDYCHDQAYDEVLERSQAFHGSMRAVEEQNNHDIQDRDGTASYQRDGRNQKVQSYCKANHLMKMSAHDCSFRDIRFTNLSNVGCDDGNLCKDVQGIVQPAGQESPTGFSQIESSDGAKLDAKTLEEDGKQVGQKDDEKKPEAIGRAGGDVRGIVSRINYSHPMGQFAIST